MKMKKLIATAAALVMVFGTVGNILPNNKNFEIDIKVYAEGEEYSGKCGENATYVYEPETKTLTISGEGYINYESEPWETYNDDIETIIIDEGITSGIDCKNNHYKNLKKTSLPSTCNFISLYNCSKLQLF